MSEQESLLDLFESFEPETPGELYARTQPARCAVIPYRHFGMQDGECTMCSTHDSHGKPGVYWCHICDRLGCWEWLGKHKD